ncbi:hypothetical protein EV424DRAFT_1645252 [Suillus variegatus]|nr:hypothetical protein EV424DRAFT_1645252 [Suillus variegatus]
MYDPKKMAERQHPDISFGDLDSIISSPKESPACQSHEPTGSYLSVGADDQEEILEDEEDTWLDEMLAGKPAEDSAFDIEADANLHAPIVTKALSDERMDSLINGFGSAQDDSAEDDADLEGMDTEWSEFDPHPPPGRNNTAATTTRHAGGSGTKNIMNRLFSRFPPPQDHTPRSRSIPLVDVFATRGKYRTANAHSGKRDKLLQLQRPPRKQAHAGASSSSTPLAVTSNVVDETTPATLQTENTSATDNPPSPLDVDHVPDISCFAALTKCFPRLSRTRRISPATSHIR